MEMGWGCWYGTEAEEKVEGVGEGVQGRVRGRGTEGRDVFGGKIMKGLKRKGLDGVQRRESKG